MSLASLITGAQQQVTSEAPAPVQLSTPQRLSMSKPSQPMASGMAGALQGGYGRPAAPPKGGKGGAQRPSQPSVGGKGGAQRAG